MPVGPENLGFLAGQPHVAVFTGLLLGVRDLDAVLDVEVRDASDLERDPGQLIGFSLGDATDACVPLSNGATDAGLDVAPALKVGQLGRKISPTKALVADLEGARRRTRAGCHLLDAGLDDAGPVLGDLSRVQAIGLQPIPVLLVGLRWLAGRVTSQGVGNLVQVGFKRQFVTLLRAVAVAGLETCQLTGQGQGSRWLGGSSGHGVAEVTLFALDVDATTLQPGL